MNTKNALVPPDLWDRETLQVLGKATDFVFFTYPFFPGCIRLTESTGVFEVFPNKSPQRDVFSREEAIFTLPKGNLNTNLLTCIDFVRVLDPTFASAPHKVVWVGTNPCAYIWFNHDTVTARVQIMNGYLHKAADRIQEYFEDTSGINSLKTASHHDREVISFRKPHNFNAFKLDFGNILARLISMNAHATGFMELLS